jgi:PPP family 3-phenylpropionic acid transporter
VLSICALYASYFAATGLHQPYFPIWLRFHGIDESRIALVLAVPMGLRIVMAPVFGWVADRVGDRALVIRVMAVLTFGLALCLGRSERFWTILCLGGLMMTVWQGLSPILDASALNLVRRGIASDYGHMRLWGSVSFIAASLLGGTILGHYGTNMVFATFTLAAAAIVGAAFAAPRTRAEAAAGTPPVAVGATRGVFLAVLLAAALIQASHAPFNGFGSIFLRGRGYSDMTIGVLWATAASSEIGMFWAGAVIARRLAPVTVLICAATGAALRWLLFPLDLGIGVLVALQLTQALTFSATYLGLMRFIADHVSERRATSAQSTYTTIHGAMMAAMMLLSGPLFQAFGGAVFTAASGVAILALAILVGVKRMRLPSHDLAFRAAP